MAVYRQVHISFWQDPDMLELTPEQKYFYLYLMTNSKTTQAGCYEISKRVVQLETGYNVETVEKLINFFVESGKIRYDAGTREILLLNWYKHNNSKSPRVKTCVENEIIQIKNKQFKKYCIDTLLNSIDTLTQKEKEEEKEEEKKPRAGKFTPPTVTEVSSYCKERKNDVDAERFCDFYQSKNWYVGKNKMKDWRAAVRTWEKKDGVKSSEVYL